MPQDLLVAFSRLLEDSDIAEDSYALGKTKVFLK